jgi:nucleoside-diphosphate-sugar epimerase
MRILLIGGDGFNGKFVTPQLQKRRTRSGIFHRTALLAELDLSKARPFASILDLTH